MGSPMEALEARLRGRGTETNESIQRRLKNAEGEISYAQQENGANFDAVIVNDSLETACRSLISVVNKYISPAADAADAAPSLNSDKTKVRKGLLSGLKN